MLREILLQQNSSLLQEIERLIEQLRNSYASLPNELIFYYESVENMCLAFRRQLEKNLNQLGIDQGNVPLEFSILPDILSNTQESTRRLQLINRFTSPVLRAGTSDRLCLKVINWLHTIHPQTQQIPAALSDGAFACWPVEPTIYFVPASAQRGLLYLALLFHEFGHLLYVRHKPEMDDLVQGLRKRISECLEPSSFRDTLYVKREVERRREIVSTWYSWAQELFCDAVGFMIGGNAFAYAFSFFLQMAGSGHYHVPSNEIATRAHPVTWIRVKLLADRMRKMQQAEAAEALEASWSRIAHALGVTEDYYGFYEPEFLQIIQQVIDDMLEESNPYCFTYHQSNLANHQYDVPVLLNKAWLMFFTNPDNFSAWEKEAIKDFLELEIGV